jgi:hypothetical protein
MLGPVTANGSVEVRITSSTAIVYEQPSVLDFLDATLHHDMYDQIR